MKTLFICSANVGRSQIAEAYYNKFTNTTIGISSALIEDRREKYNYKPSKIVIDIMKEDGIDISSQKIKLLTEEFCNNSDKIILLLEPDLEQKSEFLINGDNPTSFLYRNYKDKIQVKPIQDPFGETNDKVRIIRNEIKFIIHGMIG